MSILGIILMLAIVGFIMYLITTYIPMDPPIKNVINAVVVIIVILWLVDVVGGFGYLTRPLVIGR